LTLYTIQIYLSARLTDVKLYLHTALAGAVKKTASCGLELPAKEFLLLATSCLKQVGRLNVAAIGIVAD